MGSAWLCYVCHCQAHAPQSAPCHGAPLQHLKYHVVRGTVRAADLSPGLVLNSIMDNGAAFTVSSPCSREGWAVFHVGHVGQAPRWAAPNPGSGRRVTELAPSLNPFPVHQPPTHLAHSPPCVQLQIQESRYNAGQFYAVGNNTYYERGNRGKILEADIAVPGSENIVHIINQFLFTEDE